MKYKKGDFVRIKELSETYGAYNDPRMKNIRSFLRHYGGQTKQIDDVTKNGHLMIMGIAIGDDLVTYVGKPIDCIIHEEPVYEVKEFLPPANEGPLDETSIKSALRFNEGKPKWTLVHFNSLIPLVRVLEYGAKKYAPYNWQKPMSRMDILDSMQRHMAKLIDGEENDDESGLPHIGHILANAMFYSYHVTNK